MIKKISLALIGISTLLSAQVFATSISLDFKLIPNKKQSFSAPSKMKGICSIKSSDEGTQILHVAMNSGSGLVNGAPLNKGEQMDLYIHNGDQFSLESFSLVSIDLTNLGTHTILATCKTS